METIRGPIHGFWLACYAVEDRGVFYGYAKICTTCPTDVWEAQGEKKVVAGPVLSVEAAIDAVVDRATMRLRARDIQFSRTLPLFRRFTGT